MPGPFDDMGLPAGAWLPPWEATPQPPPQAPWEVPTDVGAAPSLGVPQLQAPEAPPEMAPAEQPQQAAPFGLPMPDPTSVPPGSRVKVSQSSSGYAPAAYKPRDPMAPLVKAEAETRALTEQSAADAEEIGRLKAAQIEHVEPWRLAQKQAQLEQNERDRVEIATAFETERNAQEQRIAQAIAEIPQRDPKRWWKNMDDFQRASAYMSASIDGYLNPGGVNQTVEQANKLAEADAYAQMTDIDTAKAKVGYQQSAYERLLGEHEFKRQQFLEQKMYRQEALAVAVEQRGMMFRSPITQLEHRNTANAIRMEGQKTRAQLAGQMSDALNAAANRALQERLQKSAQAFELAKEERARAGKAAENLAASIVMDPSRKDGRKFVVGTEVANKEQLIKNLSNEKTGLAGYANLAAGLKPYYAKMVALGRTYDGPGARTAAAVSDQQQLKSELKALRNQFLQQYRHGNFGAAMTENEDTILKSILPDPDGVTGPEGANMVKSFLDTKVLEAQNQFVNSLDLKDAATGQRVDLQTEWGLNAPTEVKDIYLETPELLDRGNAVAEGLAQIPSPAPQSSTYAGAEPEQKPKPGPVEQKATAAARSQAKLLEARANELVKRSKNYASRSSMTPEVGAQAVDTLKQWAALADRPGTEDISDKIMQQALALEAQITSERPVFENTPDPAKPAVGGYNLRTVMPQP